MYWKLALAQHPMYLLIKEDSQSIERLPPWGLPGIESYIERVKRNLDAIRQNPARKIGYEWSALELEMLAADAPEVFEELRALAQEGRVAFYNGTYAQPHLQTLSSEANYRQFEFGMRIYRELAGKQVMTYAHQETSIHDQVPQLLRAFGLEYAVLPLFPSTLAWLDEGEMLLLDQFGNRFVHGHEFVNWLGLDGSIVPLYLSRTVDDTPDSNEDEEPSDSFETFLTEQEIVGRLHEPPIVLSFPDMIEIDDDWLAWRQEFDLVLLDEALPERMRKYPPQSRARLYANWSYIEGLRAEELSRANWRAETSALQAEALGALAFSVLGRMSESTDAIWKTILKTQHHDAYTRGAVELKEKAIGWLRESETAATELAGSAARAIISQLDQTDGVGRPVIVFNTVPHAQKALLALEAEIADPLVVDNQGTPLPTEAIPKADGSTRIRFLVETAGFGYQTYWLRSGGEEAAAEEHAGPLTFENEFYRATLQPDGTVTSLALQHSAAELLGSEAIRANQLAAMDSTGLSPNNHELHVRERYQRPAAGPALHWSPATPRVRRSPLGVVFSVAGHMGPQIAASLAVNFYHHLPRIDVSWRFEFDMASIGTFYNDDSKLSVYWPLSFASDIHHDIAFGVVQTRDERPFFPASWVDISDGERGLAYMHQGTLKHWVSAGTLVNLFAYGEDTEAMGGRRRRYNWPKAFDLRLRGQHKINFAIYPHAGDWRSADVIGVARSYQTPPVGFIADAHAGALPANLELLQFSNPEIVSTALTVVDGEVVCRLYSVGEGNMIVRAKTERMQARRLRSLHNEHIDQLTPFQIGTLALVPDQTVSPQIE